MSKDIRKTIRFSEDEFENIQEKLSEHNLSFSEFSRGAILRKKIKTKLDSDYIFQLQKIGNNLNQIAKNLNSKNSDIPNSEILKVLVSIEKIMTEKENDR
jgi:hypothetical protein